MTASSADPGLHIAPGGEDEIDSLNATNLPSFMMWESPGNWAWGQIYDLFPDLQLIARTSNDEVVAAMNIVPAHRGAREPALAGYDELVEQAVDGVAAPDCLSLLSISIERGARQQGLAEALIGESRRLARQYGFSSVIGPLRPTRKHLHPLTSIEDYSMWTRPDGTAFDPWIRLHLQIGGEIVGVAPRSLVIEQAISRWESETGVAMSYPGAHIVPLALAPVISTGDVGTYAEPNVWISHTLTEENP